MPILNNYLTMYSLQIKLKKYFSSLLFRKSISAFIVKIISTGITFILQIFLARWLGLKNYGEYIYALTWINLFTLVGQGGFQNAGKKYVSIFQNNDYSRLKGFILFSYLSIAAICVIIFVIFLFLIYIISHNISSVLLNTFIIGIFVLLFNSLTQNTIGILQGYKEIVKGFAPHNILRPLIIMGGALVVYLWQQKTLLASTAMVINAIATIVVFIITFYFMTKFLPDSISKIRPKYEIKEWIKVTIPLFMVASLGFILNRTDIIMIGVLSGTSEAGIYAVANRIASLVLFGTFSVNAIIAPTIAELYSKFQFERLQFIVKRATRGLILYGIPVFLLLAVFGKDFLKLFGGEFIDGYSSLLILAGANTITTFFGTVMYIMMMTDNQNSAALIMAIVSVLNIILNMLLIPRFGIIGASLATGISTVIWNGSFYVYVKKNLSLNTSPF